MKLPRKTNSKVYHNPSLLASLWFESRESDTFTVTNFDGGDAEIGVAGCISALTEEGRDTEDMVKVSG